MPYWVYDDLPTSSIRIHRGDCPFCNNGKGLHSYEKQNYWHGPFESLNAAYAFANSCGRKDTRHCHWCETHPSSIKPRRPPWVKADEPNKERLVLTLLPAGMDPDEMYRQIQKMIDEAVAEAPSHEHSDAQEHRQQ